MNVSFSYQTAIGPITITANDRAITGLYFEGEIQPAGTETKETELLKEAARQFNEYLEGRRNGFDLPLAPQGTAFQQSVWQALLNIPYGQTRSYQQIAEAVGCPKGCRAVGLANNRNPIAVFIPCHRVIGADGRLTGYAGGLDIKARLLALEKGSKT